VTEDFAALECDITWLLGNVIGFPLSGM